MAYQLPADQADEILEALDHRERAGYQRIACVLHTREHGVIDEGIVYVADGDNPGFIGAHSDEQLAEVIHVAHGPSGSNREYLLRLEQALEDMGSEDEHVTALATLLRAKLP